MSRPVPIWSGVTDADGNLRIDSPALFRRYLGKLAGRITVVVKRATRMKSRSQLGYLFGVVYPVIADELGYREYEVDQVHDALMRQLRGLLPDPNPLKLRVSLATMTHEEVSAYIEDVRFYALTELGITTPDADKVESTRGRRTAA